MSDIADKLLHEEGWAIKLEAVGYLEGPKWWEGTAWAMGCIAPRVVETTKRHRTIDEAIKELDDLVRNGSESDEPDDKCLRHLNECSNFD